MTKATLTVAVCVALLWGGTALAAQLDNGDGTVTDNNTGLMWEKLSHDGSHHEYSTQYTWSDAVTKITSLNTARFAGYTDWRLPVVTELKTLVNRDAQNPTIGAEFNRSCEANCTVTTCSCTKSAYYWSATTIGRMSVRTVDFESGGEGSDPKTYQDDGGRAVGVSHYVRAVRGGL